MNSIRSRFVVASIVGVTAVMVVAGVLTHVLVDRSLAEAFDRSLRAELEAIAGMVEVDATGLVFDTEDRDLRDFDVAGARGARGYLRIVAASGRVLYESPGLAGERMEFFDVGAATEGPVFGHRTIAGARVRAVGIRVEPHVDTEEIESMAVDPAAVLAEREPVDIVLARHDEFRGPFLARYRSMSGWVLLVSLVGIAFLVDRIASREARGLRKLADRIHRLPVDGTASALAVDDELVEVRPIVLRINTLLERVRDALERERALGLDVAHEVRTPLAGLRTTIEVAMLRDREGSEYRDALARTLEIVRRQEIMVVRLLRLHQIESKQLRPESTPVDLEALLREQWSIQEVRAAERRLRAEWKVAESTFVRTDPGLAAVLISSLLDNAVSHANRGGTIRIEARSVASHAIVRLVNSGSSVDSHDVPRLTERFVRGDAGRGGDGEHVGLGLTLAKRAADRIGVELAISASRGGDFAVILSFPEDVPA